jgi:hypothetical protein
MNPEMSQEQDPLRMIQAQMGQMAAQMRSLYEQNQAQAEEIRQLKEQATPTKAPQLASTSQTGPSTTGDTPKRQKERLPTVPEFSGKRHGWEEWLLQMKLKLAIDGPAIGSELEKFAYIVSRLRDDAAKATRAYCAQHLTNNTGNSKDLLKYLETTYGDPNKRERALQDLHQLRQGEKENFASFLPKFETILANAGLLSHDNSDDWNFQKIGYLKHALNKDMRERLVGLSNVAPKDYAEFVSYLQTIGSEIAGLRILSKNQGFSAWPPTPKASVAEPMDWEPTKTNRATTVEKPAKKRAATWVNSETISFRKANNLCLRCGHAGHRIKDCSFDPPVRPISTRVNNTKVQNLSAARPERDIENEENSESEKE